MAMEERGECPTVIRLWGSRLLASRVTELFRLPSLRRCSLVEEEARERSS